MICSRYRLRISKIFVTLSVEEIIRSALVILIGLSQLCILLWVRTLCLIRNMMWVRWKGMGFKIRSTREWWNFILRCHTRTIQMWNSSLRVQPRWKRWTLYNCRRDRICTRRGLTLLGVSNGHSRSLVMRSYTTWIRIKRVLLTWISRTALSTPLYADRAIKTMPLSLHKDPWISKQEHSVRFSIWPSNRKDPIRTHRKMAQSFLRSLLNPHKQNLNHNPNTQLALMVHPKSRWSWMTTMMMPRIRQMISWLRGS